MAKTPPITNVTSGFSSTTALNNNFTSLRDGFNNTLSLDGSTPNAMQTELDLANNDIINAGSVETDTLLLGGVLMTPSGVDPVYSGTISSFGASLIDDVNAAAGRTTLGLSTVASTGSYTDLSNQPSLNFASTAQGALADTALQVGDSLDAGDLVNALPAIDGSNLTGIATPALEIIAYARVSNATTNPLTVDFSTGFSSMARTSQGNYTFTFSSARSSVDYMVFCQCASGSTSRTQAVNTQSTTAFNVDTRVISSGGTTDEDFNLIVYALPS
mgnify:CR=1 FL=1